MKRRRPRPEGWPEHLLVAVMLLLALAM